MAVKKVKKVAKKAKKPVKKAVKKVVKKDPAKKVVKKAVKKVVKKAPAKKVVKKVVKKAAPVAKAASAVAAKPLAPAPVVTQPRIKAWHVVAAGDTPSTITQKYYGSTEPAKWTAIYEINKTAIGPDPNQLRPGMVLRIPEA
jgi:nucleoid-associated protein YgaU